MEQVKLLRRRTTDLLANAQQSVTSKQQSFVSSAQQNIANAQQSLPSISMPQFNLRGLRQSLQSPTGDNGPQGTWERIDDIPALKRSSHSLDIVGSSAYIFGGEVSSGDPVDNDMHVVRLPISGASTDYYRIKAIPEKPDETDPSGGGGDDADSQLHRKTESSASSDGAGSEAGSHSSPRSKGKGKERAMDIPRPDLGDVPTPRVGHATAVIGSRIFLFGGRGGPDMQPIQEAGRVWVFDTRTRSWSHLDPAPAVKGGTMTIHPAARSDHCATSTDKPQDFGSPAADVSAAAAPASSPVTMRSRAQSWRDWAVGDISKTGIPQDPVVGHVAESAIDQDARGYGTLFIHAGGLAGDERANDVWAFDVRSRMWSELPSAPGPARAGAAICISKSRLFRFGGIDSAAAMMGGQLDFLHLEVETMDDKRGGSQTEVAVRARDGWQTILQHPTSTYSSTVTPSTPLSSPRVGSAPEIPVVDGVQEWPCPRSAATLEAITAGGGREFLVLAFGEAAPSADDGGSSKFLDDVWLFQVPPQGMSAASVTAAVMQAVGRKTGEGRWTRVATRPHDDEDEWAGAPRARGRLASAPMTNLEDSGLLVWGGLGDGDQRLGDGWVLRL